ncbi:MAG TPA: YHS domain-containing (seleno)protein [Burkholderiaceae bacterium]|nr:YHS domain-containing (seleno)protein [Burkholderiaceae bacterium]
MTLKLKSAVAGIALTLFSLTSHAGEFNEHSGVAIKGYDPVAFFKQNKPVRGNDDLRFDYKGSTFVFASAENRAAFAADPVKYAPQYGGYCAFGTARGYKADIDPSTFTVVDGRLYLNYNTQVQKEWAGDRARFIGQANERWPTVSKTEKVFR